MRTRVEAWGGEAWGGSSAALADHKESVTIAVAARSGLSVLGMENFAVGMEIRFISFF